MKIFNKLFKKHSYEIIRDEIFETLYEGQEVAYHILVQRCPCCGDVKYIKKRI